MNQYMSAKETLIIMMYEQYGTTVNIPYFNEIINKTLFLYGTQYPESDAEHPRQYIGNPELPYTTVRLRFAERLRAILDDNTDYDAILVKMFETVDSAGIYYHTTQLLHKFRLCVNDTDPTYEDSSDSD